MHINVLYSADENYVPHAGTSMLSLLSNNVNVEKISVYFIDNNVTKESKDKLISIAESFNREIKFISIDSLLGNFDKKDDFPLSGYARLFISNAINVDKILYIDCDTIINNTLEDLWNIDLDDFLVAGVQDNPAMYMAEIVGMNRNDRYINSGVLLMNLKKWRDINLEHEFIDFMKKYDGKVPHHDQGLINGVCKGKILILNPKYNVMPQFLMYNAKQIKRLYDIKHYYLQEEIDEGVNNPVIVHYISKFYNRPWFKDCTHPMKDWYLNYLSESGWETRLKKSNVNYKLMARRLVFHYLPFQIFYITERLLDIKRKRNIKSIYKYID